MIRLLFTLVGTCLLAIMPALPAAASPNVIAVDVTEWRAVGEFDDPANSGETILLPEGTSVLGFSWSNLTFSAVGFNWLSDLVLSVTDLSSTTSAVGYLDWSPAGLDMPGTFGPASGDWGGAQGRPGPFLAGAPFIVSEQGIRVSAYSAFITADPIEVHSGTLYIQILEVPEPSSILLFVSGLLYLLISNRSRLSGLQARIGLGRELPTCHT